MGRQEDAEKGRHNRIGQADRQLDDRDLQHAASLAFLARLAGFAMLGGAFHVVATVLAPISHHRHARRLHRARCCRCLNTRHPAEGKRQADQENEAAPQVAFHGGSLVVGDGLYNYEYPSLPMDKSRRF